MASVGCREVAFFGEFMPKWERLPEEFYSMRRAQICLRLYFCVGYEERKFCENNDILPPAHLVRQKLVAWIQRRMNGDRRTIRRKIIIPLGQLRLDFGNGQAIISQNQVLQ